MLRASSLQKLFKVYKKVFEKDYCKSVLAIYIIIAVGSAEWTVTGIFENRCELSIDSAICGWNSIAFSEQ